MSDLSGVPPALKARVDALRTGAIPAAPPGPGAILPITWAMLVLALIPGIAGIAASLSSSKEEGCLGAGLAVGGFFLFIFLICLAVDLSTPSPKTRTSPERAIRAFYGSLRRKQYGRAYACLSPLDRTADQRPVLAVPVLSVREQLYTFKDKDDFGRYWRAQSGLSTEVLGGYHKTIRAKILKVEKIRPDLAAVEVRLELSGYPTFAILGVLCGLLPVIILIAVLTKRESYTFRKLVVQKSGLWWIVNGEFTPDGDEAVERLLLTAGAS